MTNIKEKVLNAMFTKEFLKKDYTPETRLTMNGIKSAITLTLAEVGKVIDELPKWNEAMLGGKPAMKFEPKKGYFIKYHDLKQKLGIK